MATLDFSLRADAESSVEELWNTLRSKPEAVCLDDLVTICSGLLPDASRSCDITRLIDSYALHTRLDAVDEQGRPFVPFVKPLSPREMQRFGYGMLLDTREHTILVSPHALVDIAGSVDMFLVQLRIIEIVGTHNDVPSITYRVGFVLCFRLRLSTLLNTEDGVEGYYTLSGVFVSGHQFQTLHDDLRAHGALAPQSEYYSRYTTDNSTTIRERHEAWSAWVRLTGGSILHDPRSPRMENPRTCGYDVEGAGTFEEVDAAVVAEAPSASSINCGEDFIPRRCTYTVDRMASRVCVLQRSLTFPEHWVALCGEVGLSEHSAHVARIIMKDTRAGVNSLEHNELTAHVPSNTSSHCVYATSAEERLRLWIGAALATAERSRLHQIYLRVDVPMILSRCCELLSQRYEESAQEGARKRILHIILATIEEFLQTSGIIWRAVVVVNHNEPNDDRDFETAREQLDAIQREKILLEQVTPIEPSPTKGCSQIRAPRTLSDDMISTLSPTRKLPSPRFDSATVETPAEVRLPQIFNVSPLPTETDLRKVFKRLDTRNEGVIDAANLKRLLLPADETSRALGSDKDITLRGTIAPQRTQDAHLRCGTVISPIDSCGVPFTENAVDDYLEKYCKVHKDKVTFPEFCSMMMDIARR
jgi:hypothetical protein